MARTASASMKDSQGSPPPAWQTRRNGATLIATLDRFSVRNALNFQCWEELDAILDFVSLLFDRHGELDNPGSPRGDLFMGMHERRRHQIDLDALKRVKIHRRDGFNRFLRRCGDHRCKLGSCPDCGGTRK